MSRKSVGYFEGMDSVVLTSLICDGNDTIPISNGLDNHGRHVRSLNEATKVDILIGYLHKIYAPVGTETMAEDMFHICQTYQIPFLVVVPKELHECAVQLFDIEPPEYVELVDPSEVLEVARRKLKE